MSTKSIDAACILTQLIIFNRNVMAIYTFDDLHSGVHACMNLLLKSITVVYPAPNYLLRQV